MLTYTPSTLSLRRAVAAATPSLARSRDDQRGHADAGEERGRERGGGRLWHDRPHARVVAVVAPLPRIALGDDTFGLAVEQDHAVRRDEHAAQIVGDQDDGVALGVQVAEHVEEDPLVDDLGADSLDTVELVMAFEEEFGVEVPEGTRVLTTQDILALVQKLVELPSKLGLYIRESRRES